MSDFTVEVVKIEKIENIDGADFIQVANIGDYKSIIRKDQFKEGELVVYIPEASFLPENIVVELGLEGKLSGPKGNRVKAIKLRGVLSQGLLYPNKGWEFGQDVQEILGITKYKQEIPAILRGDVWNAGESKTISYDIQNIKKYNRIFNEDDEVVITEKIHGTNFCVGHIKDFEKYNGKIIHSKGMGAKGLPFKLEEDSQFNERNVYIKCEKKFDIHNKLLKAFNGETVFIIGEIFGPGSGQDLKYNVSNEDEYDYRVFDIHLGDRYTGHYLNDSELDHYCNSMGLLRVPVLYRGKFSKEKVKELTSGMETVSGKSVHIREGVVIRTTIEMKQTFGRKQLKSVSEQYLLRKSKSSEEPTEYE